MSNYFAMMLNTADALPACEEVESLFRNEIFRQLPA